jgi:hypothetical protein
MLAYQPEETGIFSLQDNGLVSTDDLPFLIELLNEVPDQGQRVIASLIVFLREPDVEIFDLIMRAAPTNFYLRQELDRYLAVVDPASAEAAELRTRYQKRNRRPVRTTINPSPAVRVSVGLDLIEGGRTDHFIQLTHELALTPDSNSNFFEDDLTERPGWVASDDATRLRIVNAAEAYLKAFDPLTVNWIATDGIYGTAHAGYHALRLLHKESSAHFEQLPWMIWEKCAALVFAIPFGNGCDADAALLKRAYEVAPDAVIRTLRMMCSPPCSGYRRPHMSRLTPLFDTCLNDACIEIMSLTNEAPVFGQVLRLLLGQRSQEAQLAAFRAIDSRKESAEAQQKATMAATALIGFSTKDDWDEIWQALSQDDAFTVGVVASLANNHTDGGHGFLQRLSERQLADLFLWLASHVQFKDDTHADGMVGPRHHAQSLRDEVLSVLKGCATQVAVHELERITTALPELRWLKIHVLETEGQMLRQSWKPVQPAEILRIARDNDARLVQSAEQLLHVIVESLDRLQDSLQGQTSRAIELWNEVSVSKKVTEYTPKDENRFSDYVKLHLERDIRDRGIVVNREVEIRRGTGGAPGERTDIHVEATSEAGDKAFRIIRVIVEAKGAWHKELMTAMQTQLVDRYLRDNECQTGLYLVGWFDCDQWLDIDDRKGKPKSVSLGELRKELVTQAQNLSTGRLTIGAHVLDASLR